MVQGVVQVKPRLHVPKTSFMTIRVPAYHLSPLQQDPCKRSSGSMSIPKSGTQTAKSNTGGVLHGIQPRGTVWTGSSGI